MPELPEYIASHKGGAARMVFKLVRVALPVPQCMTTADVAITYGGETYLPMAGLKVGGTRVSEADQSAVAANVTIGNADGTWGYRWASLSPTDRHPEITVADAWMDPAEPWLGPQGVRTLLAGIVESTTWGATDITLTHATITMDPATHNPLDKEAVILKLGDGAATFVGRFSPKTAE